MTEERFYESRDVIEALREENASAATSKRGNASAACGTKNDRRMPTLTLRLHDEGLAKSSLLRNAYCGAHRHGG